METLNFSEVEMVSGSGIIEWIAYAMGYTLAKATRTQQAIDDMGNSMLSAMQYGA